MAFNKGDRVNDSPTGVEMEVVACSGMHSMCRWQQDGREHKALFELSSLRPAGVRLQQQFQQQQQPNFDRPPANDASGEEIPKPASASSAA